MKLDDYKIILYRQPDGSWVAEVPAIPGCYALMPSKDEALAELDAVFVMLSQEYAEKGLSLPADATLLGPGQGERQTAPCSSQNRR